MNRYVTYALYLMFVVLVVIAIVNPIALVPIIPMVVVACLCVVDVLIGAWREHTQVVATNLSLVVLEDRLAALETDSGDKLVIIEDILLRITEVKNSLNETDSEIDKLRTVGGFKNIG